MRSLLAFGSGLKEACARRLRASRRRVSLLWARVRPRLGGWARELLRDLHIYGGIAMVGYGAHSIVPASGWLIAGVCLSLIGLFGVPEW